MFAFHRGRPPYPLIKDLTKDEFEYLHGWLDMYLLPQTENAKDDAGELIGYLKEFKGQQASGVTTFIMPPRDNDNYWINPGM